MRIGLEKGKQPQSSREYKFSCFYIILQPKWISFKDNNTLLRAKADIRRGKSVVINKYKDRVYVHLFGAKGKHVALYLEEFMNLVSLKDEVEEACSLFQVEVSTVLRICLFFHLFSLLFKKKLKLCKEIVYMF